MKWKIKEIYHRSELNFAAKKFDQEIRLKIKQGLVKTPHDENGDLKSSKKGFNHINEYAIRNQTLWYRPLDKKYSFQRTWEPLFFEGSLEGLKPVKLSVDGANLVIIDNKGDVHYRKVLLEARSLQEWAAPEFQRHLKYYKLPKTPSINNQYIAIDTTKNPAWIPSWYSFPVLHHLVNYFTGKRLHVAAGIISHRGRFTGGYKDAEGKFHETGTGVTTLYELNPDKQSISKYDPWSPLWAKIEIYFPQTKTKSFKAKTLDASSSTLMALGYESNRKTGKKTLKLLTNLCDIDTSGGNPGLKYAYEAKKAQGKDIRILYDVVKNEGWKEHELPKDAEKIFNQISIFQTGLGDEARTLRIAAQHKNGKYGYFEKTLKPDSQWTFIYYPYIKSFYSLKKEKNMRHQTSNIVHDYEGFFTVKKTNEKIQTILKNFGEKGSHWVLNLKMGGQKYKLGLHKRLGWKTFLGLKHKIFEIFELVIPKTIENKHLIDIFKGQRSLNLKLKKDKDHLILYPNTLNNRHYFFIFSSSK